MNQKVLVKLPCAMKAQLDRLRTRKGINVSAFIRHAIARALKRAA
jgi:post-segregation antitoxin (ccd killing protein)